MMKEKYLKRIIGIIYFVFAFFLLKVAELFNLSNIIYRYVWCISASAFGVGLRAYLYFGLVYSSDKVTDKNSTALMSYFLIYPAIFLSLSSLIFIVFYNTFITMEQTIFYILTLFLFTFIGFNVYDMRKLLKKWKI